MSDLGVTEQDFRDDTICKSRRCQINFLAKKRNVLSFMTHILQDMVLFTNKLDLPGYYDLFEKISRREHHRSKLTRYMKNKSIIEDDLRKLRGIKERLSIGRGTDDDIKMGVEGANAEMSENEEMLRDGKDLIKTTEIEITTIQNVISEMVERLRNIDSINTTERVIKLSLPLESVERMKDIRMLLRKIIYLRKLDNICRTKYNEDGSKIENEAYVAHVKWIQMLESIFDIVHQKIEG